MLGVQLRSVLMAPTAMSENSASAKKQTRHLDSSFSSSFLWN